MLLLILLLLAMFTTGVALVLAAANVFFHDVNYLWGIVVQLLFYATPIIYNPNNPQIPKAIRVVATYGPTASFITAARQVMYDLAMPSAKSFAFMTFYALTAFVFGNLVFSRLSPRFAEEM